jgi:hypothetical protein
MFAGGNRPAPLAGYVRSSRALAIFCGLANAAILQTNYRVQKLDALLADTV